jgi:hypothetical protein
VKPRTLDLQQQKTTIIIIIIITLYNMLGVTDCLTGYTRVATVAIDISLRVMS